MLRAAAFLGASLAASGCSDDQPNRPGQGPVTPSPVSAEIKLGRALWTRGVEQGNPAEEFGKIVGAALDRRRKLYLLDALSQNVRVFDAEGTFVHAFGSAGHGPGELADPQAMLIDPADTLYILDAENGLSLFRIQPDGVEYVRTINLGIQAHDFCFMGQHIFVFAYRRQRTIHEFDRNGMLLHLFGEAFGPAKTAVEEVISGDGKIACFEESQLVVVASKLLPDVRAYHVANRTLAWSDSLRDFTPIVIQIGPDRNRYTMMPRRGGHAETAVLRPLNSKLLLAQSRRAPRSEPIEAIASCIIAVATGQCAWKSQSIPLLPVVAGNWAVAISDTLFPVVRVVETKVVIGHNQ
ncbi:MAG: 6-bladed beta-propeller [Longimicrobiales bacterium]